LVKVLGFFFSETLMMKLTEFLLTIKYLFVGGLLALQGVLLKGNGH